MTHRDRWWFDLRGSGVDKNSRGGARVPLLAGFQLVGLGVKEFRESIAVAVLMVRAAGEFCS
jgi:hypothetical protein